jgi:Xaa-Pro aminopeptidase
LNPNIEFKCEESSSVTSNSIVQQKLEQAEDILRETGIDIWLVVARESDTLGDPSLPLILGTSVTWESAFLISHDGSHKAIVGTGDVDNVLQTGAWTDVEGYVEGLGPPLRKALEERNPASIGLSYSTDNSMADGLTYGMYLELQRFLSDTPFWDRITSAEPVASRLRARKSDEEIRRIREAIATTEKIWSETADWLRPGLSEKQISDFMHSRLDHYEVGSSWDWKYCPTVMAGPKSPEGHVGPSDIVTEAGHLLAIDFGVQQNEYTSDMQRTFYFLQNGETDAPDELHEAFGVVDKAIQSGAAALKPGVPGWEVDAAARQVLEEYGAAEWKFAFGHQMGRACHDGGAVLGPKWDRYGQRPYDLIEPSHVYTLEIGFPVEGRGRVQLEEDVVVTETGCEFLTNPQRRLMLIG